VILSPHLDDAALSCGGLVAALAKQRSVEIWTIFSGAPLFGPYSPLADWFHGISGGWSGARLAWRRRREDVKACHLIGATPRHFAWFDAVYRFGSTGEPLYHDTRQESWNSQEDALVTAIAGALRRKLSFEDLVIAPLGIGQHVDHLILRSAAQHLELPELAYYVDVPYIRKFPEELYTRTSGLEKHPYQISEEDKSAWIRSVMAYKTQIRMLEDAVGSLEALITDLRESGNLCLYQ
jgi:LmbE family N-acetylglucosaminyl deacetylase